MTDEAMTNAEWWREFHRGMNQERRVPFAMTDSDYDNYYRFCEHPPIMEY